LKELVIAEDLESMKLALIIFAISCTNIWNLIVGARECIQTNAPIWVRIFNSDAMTDFGVF
jgi:hypothetical protein